MQISESQKSRIDPTTISFFEVDDFHNAQAAFGTVLKKKENNHEQKKNQQNEQDANPNNF